MNERRTRELFEALTPTAKQRAGMLRGILAKSATDAARKTPRRFSPRALPASAVICFVLLLTGAAAA
ncbi:MAG: hypothetical protein LBD95_00960, partial [Clostridiales Family XIII bacterium]|nr:hypothetical protein [Clostridiales Family XIII bacterium]